MACLRVRENLWKTCGFLVNHQLVLVARPSGMLAASPALGARDWVSWDWESGVRRVFIDYTLREGL